MSLFGSKSKHIPILSYRLDGCISDELGEDKMRWSHHHILETIVGTFTITKVGRRWHWYFKHHPGSLYIGPFNIDYERPDFATYLSGDGEYLDSAMRRYR